MTASEFNEKYKEYLEPRFYGLAIDIPEVVEFLDKEFPKLIKGNMQPFKYSQIKTKFGYACVYCNANPAVVRHLENDIDKIIKSQK
mgnify:CR=1 FL=1